MLQARRVYVLTSITFIAVLLVLGSTFWRHSQPDDGDPDHRSWVTNILPQVQDPIRVDWSRFAYVQYATNTPYLCNSVMLFARLQHLGCKSERLLLYPSEFPLDDNSTEALLLKNAREKYNVVLKPIEIQRFPSNDRELEKEPQLSRES